MIRTVVVTLLVFLLGSTVEYRYNIIQKLPLSTSLKKSIVASDLPSSQLATLLNTSVPSDRQNVDFGVFWQAWNILEAEYNETEKIDPEKMVDGAVAGMVASLGDPYTSYLPPEDKVRSGEDLAGSFFGVGIELGYVEGVLAVVAPIDGTPAGSADVEAGDLIINVKDEAKDLDESTNGWSLTKAVDNIRGPKGSPVTLTLLRRSKGPEPFEVVLNRGEIIVKSAELKWVEQSGKKVAHIKLSRFGERTLDEWDAIVTDILAQKSSTTGIVLDMRNDPGGFFDDALAIASDFIPDGLIVSQKGRHNNQDFKSLGTARLKGIPLVVLVNGGSASASEIVAGAIKDRVEPAQLVGQKTFGKGTVQDRRDLKNGGGIHVTIARWILPSGEWIHEKGIPVDIEVTDNPDTENDEMLDKAIEVL